jgi:chorismate mutase-like protein
MSINEWRKRIDRVDARLVKLLNQRSRYAAVVALLKRKTRLPHYQPEREREILKRVQRINRGPLSDAALQRLFRRILAEARAVGRRAARKKKKERKS